MPARLARVLLIVALLAGWQAALQHPIEHVDEIGQLVHLNGGHSDHGSPLCDALAALTACAAGTLAFSAAVLPEHVTSSGSFDAPRVAQAPPFLSQGPPIAAV